MYDALATEHLSQIMTLSLTDVAIAAVAVAVYFGGPFLVGAGAGGTAEILPFPAAAEGVEKVAALILAFLGLEKAMNNCNEAN